MDIIRDILAFSLLMIAFVLTVTFVRRHCVIRYRPPYGWGEIIASILLLLMVSSQLVHAGTMEDFIVLMVFSALLPRGVRIISDGLRLGTKI